MTDLFDKSIASADPEYLALMDQPRHADLRRCCSELWQEFAPYADTSFVQQFALQPHQRFWEMYLGVRLLELGFDLQLPASDEGPDLHLVIDGRDVWIEATVPGEGTGVDAVPTLEEHDGYVPIPESRIILRFTNSIAEKKGKLERYLTARVIRPDDAYVIAISGGRIQLLLFDAPLPAIVKALYPIGEHQVIVDTEKAEVIEERYAPRYEVQKASGSPVSTHSFLDPSCSGISGVIYSRVALMNLPKDPAREFLFIHNLVSGVPLERGWLKIGTDYWVEEGQLRSAPN